MVHSRSAASTVSCIACGHAHYLHATDLTTTCIALLSNGLLLLQYWEHPCSPQFQHELVCKADSD